MDLAELTASIEPPADDGGQGAAATEQPEAPGGTEAAASAPETSEQPDPAKPKEPETPEPPDDAAIFSDEALGTPEGIQAARDRVAAIRAEAENERREASRVYLRIQNRETKFKRDKQELDAARANFRSIENQVNAQLDALRNGDAATALQALGNLTGRPPAEFFEQLSLHVASNGKRKETPELAAVRQELAAVRQELQRSQQAAQQQAVDREIDAARRQLAQVATNAQSYPHLARIAQSNAPGVVDHLQQMIVSAYEAGSPIDFATAAATLETQLVEHYQQAGQVTGAPQGANPGVGRETDARTAKPEAAAPRVPGKSLNPNLASQSGGSRREATEEERMAALANDPSFWAQTGLPI